MKTLRCSACRLVITLAFVLIATLALRAADLPRVSPAITQIVKMHDAGVGEDVMLAYVQNSTVPKPNVDELIYLHEAGVSKTVVTTLLSRRDAVAQTQITAPETSATGNS